MSQQSLSELKSSHVDDLKIPDFDERLVRIVAGLQKSKYTRFEVRDFYNRYCI